MPLVHGRGTGESFPLVTDLTAAPAQETKPRAQLLRLGPMAPHKGRLPPLGPSITVCPRVRAGPGVGGIRRGPPWAATRAGPCLGIRPSTSWRGLSPSQLCPDCLGPSPFTRGPTSTFVIPDPSQNAGKPGGSAEKPIPALPRLLVTARWRTARQGLGPGRPAVSRAGAIQALRPPGMHPRGNEMPCGSRASHACPKALRDFQAQQPALRP